MRTRTALAKASQPGTPVSFQVPTGACDCHTHIHGDPEKFPFFSGRVYTPEPALPEEMAALHRALHIQRVVIVTPSVYGTDNSSTLYGMKARGADARGVAVIDDKTPDSELDAMGQAGVRGIRLNLATAGISEPSVGRQRFHRFHCLGRRNHHGRHHLVDDFEFLPTPVQPTGIPVWVGAFSGNAKPLRRGARYQGFFPVDLQHPDQLAEAVATIAAQRTDPTAPYDVAVELEPGVDPAPYVANADRVVWGTDWPHPNAVTPPGRKPSDVTPLLQVDDGRVLNQLVVWAPDPAIRKKILVENPARLYGF